MVFKSKGSVNFKYTCEIHHHLHFDANGVDENNFAHSTFKRVFRNIISSNLLPCELRTVSTVILLVSEMRELRHKKIKWFVIGLTIFFFLF